MPVPHPTVDELVEALKRSSLPTVLVEGDDDMTIFRWLEETLGTLNANPLPCHSRETLLAVFARRSEFPAIPTAFVADRDLWTFGSVPSEYDGIVFTLGYCIENDLYSGAESLLMGLLSPRERSDHHLVLNCIIEWFAFEVSEHRAGREAQVAHHVNEVVAPGMTVISDDFKLRRGMTGAPDAATLSELRAAHVLKLRGKQLFEVLVRFLSAPMRAAKHSRRALYEMALKVPPRHEPMVRLMAEIQNALAA